MLYFTVRTTLQRVYNPGGFHEDQHVRPLLHARWFRDDRGALRRDFRLLPDGHVRLRALHRHRLVLLRQAGPRHVVHAGLRREGYEDGRRDADVACRLHDHDRNRDRTPADDDVPAHRTVGGNHREPSRGRVVGGDRPGDGDLPLVLLRSAGVLLRERVQHPGAVCGSRRLAGVHGRNGRRLPLSRNHQVADQPENSAVSQVPHVPPRTPTPPRCSRVAGVVCFKYFPKSHQNCSDLICQFSLQVGQPQSHNKTPAFLLEFCWLRGWGSNPRPED